jgi:hypothetical protein
MDMIKAQMIKVMGGDKHGVGGMISLLTSRSAALDEDDVAMLSVFVQFVLPQSMRNEGLEALRPVLVAHERASEKSARDKENSEKYVRGA